MNRINCEILLELVSLYWNPFRQKYASCFKSCTSFRGVYFTNLLIYLRHQTSLLKALRLLTLRRSTTEPIPLEWPLNSGSTILLLVSKGATMLIHFSTGCMKTLCKEKQLLLRRHQDITYMYISFFPLNTEQTTGNKTKTPEYC